MHSEMHSELRRRCQNKRFPAVQGFTKNIITSFTSLHGRSTPHIVMLYPICWIKWNLKKLFWNLAIVRVDTLTEDSVIDFRFTMSHFYLLEDVDVLYFSSLSHVWHKWIFILHCYCWLVQSQIIHWMRCSGRFGKCSVSFFYNYMANRLICLISVASMRRRSIIFFFL